MAQLCAFLSRFVLHSSFSHIRVQNFFLATDYRMNGRGNKANYKKATFALVVKDKKTMPMSFRGHIASSFKQTPDVMCNV